MIPDTVIDHEVPREDMWRETDGCLLIAQKVFPKYYRPFVREDHLYQLTVVGFF